MSRYDYIVVGAGSAGCVLAERLSEDPNVKVLLVEAGAPPSVFINMPAGIRVLYNSAKYNWRFWTEPQQYLNNRKIFIPRGRAIGGSSAINSMIAMRCNPADYDGWAAQCMPQWTFEAMRPYFHKLENATQVTNGRDPDRGYSGPIALSYGPIREPGSALIESAVNAGLPRNQGFNGPSQVGAGFYELTIANGKRSGAFKYLDLAKGRGNLTIMAKTAVRRIHVEGMRARGIVIGYKGRETTLFADREVLLAAGAIKSPQLLMLSGIGPADHLGSFGVRQVLDQPNVGENLQDHLDCAIRFEAVKPTTLTPYLGIIRGGLAGLHYILTGGGGPGASNGVETGVFWGPDRLSSIPEWQAHYIDVLRNAPNEDSVAHGFAVRVCQLRPASRGNVRLRNANPADDPLIDPRFASESSDLVSLRNGISEMCDITRLKPFADLCKRTFDPEAFAGGATLEAWLRNKAETIYHPVGTCRMGNDKDAVVDPNLRVRGIESLRVIDGSIMPTLVGGNPNLPIMAIAEKISEHIRYGDTSLHARLANQKLAGGTSAG